MSTFEDWLEARMDYLIDKVDEVEDDNTQLRAGLFGQRVAIHQIQNKRAEMVCANCACSYGEWALGRISLRSECETHAAQSPTND